MAISGSRRTFLCLWAALLLLVSTAYSAMPAAKTGVFKLLCLEMEDTGRGYGLGIILQTPEGHTYLYDTGVGYPSMDDPSGWLRDINTGRDQILPYLKAHHITRIDGVVISHAHFDHWGGLLWLADHFPIVKLYDSGYEFPGPVPAGWKDELEGYSRLRQKFKDRGAYQELHMGDILPWDKHLEVEVLAPPKVYFGERTHERSQAIDPPVHYLPNANSVALRIRHGKVVVVLPGDIQKEDQEQSLLPLVRPSKLRADILIAPGHGSNSCQSPRFAQTSRPSVVIASIVPRALGSCNVREMYAPLKSRVYITAEQGWIEVTSNGSKYSVRTDRIVQKRGVAIPTTAADTFSPQGIPD